MRMCIFIIANITILYETRAVDHCYSNGAKYVTRCSATCSEFVEIFNDVFTSPLVESEGERTLKIVQNIGEVAGENKPKQDCEIRMSSFHIPISITVSMYL